MSSPECPVPRVAYIYADIYVICGTVPSSLHYSSSAVQHSARYVRHDQCEKRVQIAHVSIANCAWCGMVRWCEIHHIDHDRSREPLPTKVARRQVRVGVALNPIFLRSSFSLPVLLLSCVVFCHSLSPSSSCFCHLLSPQGSDKAKAKGQAGARD